MTIPNYYFAVPNYKKFLSEDPLTDTGSSDSDYDPNSDEESTSSEEDLTSSEEEIKKK